MPSPPPVTNSHARSRTHKHVRTHTHTRVRTHMRTHRQKNPHTIIQHTCALNTHTDTQTHTNTTQTHRKIVRAHTQYRNTQTAMIQLVRVCLCVCFDFVDVGTPCGGRECCILQQKTHTLLCNTQLFGTAWGINGRSNICTQ